MYEAFFKLRSKPFQLNPDPAFFFGSRGHRRAMAYLEYGLHQSEGFIVVTGDIGAGKTTLLRSLIENLDPNQVVAANLVSTQVDADNILRMVAAAFGVPARGLDKAGLLLALETFFVSLAAAGKRALLIVDEAQNLGQQAVEELRMLSNFQLDDHALVQSFLVGQPEFREMMQGAQMQQLRQRVIASYHLGPMDAAETRAYIEHRLRHVGWQNDPEFAEDAFAPIYAYSGGVPRRINTLCDRLMLAAYLAERHRIGADEVREVVNELKQEFVERGARAPVRPAPEPGSTVEAERLRVPGRVADEAAGLPARYELQRIEARLAALEKSMSATLDVLSELLDAVRRDDSEDKRNEG